MAKKGGFSEKRHPAIEAIGWIGAALVLVAYGLTTYGVIPAGGALNLILNILGSICIIAIAEVKKLFQSVVLNVIWGVVALIALVRLWIG